MSHVCDAGRITYILLRSFLTQVREAQNCLPRPKWATGFLFWYKKTVIPKKKVFAARNLKNCLPNLP